MSPELPLDPALAVPRATAATTAGATAGPATSSSGAAHLAATHATTAKPAGHLMEACSNISLATWLPVFESCILTLT